MITIAKFIIIYFKFLFINLKFIINILINKYIIKYLSYFINFNKTNFINRIIFKYFR